MDGKDVRILARLYWKQFAVVRTDHGNSEGIEIRMEHEAEMCAITIPFQSIHGAYF